MSNLDSTAVSSDLPPTAAQYLESTFYFDYDAPEVRAFADKVLGDEALSPKEMAVRLYYAVRDDIKYNPYVFKTDPKSLSASYCLNDGVSYCIPKAVLLGAVCRYKGIPARLGLADVKNHLSSPQLIEFLRSDVFVMHGFIELYLDGKWVKATPAFNAALCEKMGVETLAFNGEDDSIFQEFNDEGHKHMEYLADHGTFDDVPMEFIAMSVAKAYPHLADPAVLKKFGLHSLEEDMSDPAVS